jgi:heat shock protein HtpX
MPNNMKTVILMASMMGLILLIGSQLGGEGGLLTAFVFSLVMNFGMYWFSARIVLATYRAKEVTEKEQPKLYSTVRRLAIQASMPMPKVYIIPGETPNAFATGRDQQHAAVAATEGLLKILSDDELEAVCAHELAHVRNRDILIGTLVATLAGTITFIAHMARFAMIFGGSSRDQEDSNPLAGLIMILLAPIAAMLIQMAISRSREFAADEGGARISHRPLSLVNALRKLEKASEQIPMENAGTATAHMFTVNPLAGGGLMKLFSTHPSTEERIKRLERIAMGGIG